MQEFYPPTSWYFDSSSTLKLIKTEAESTALREAISAERPQLLSSHLMEAELRRAAHRDTRLTQSRVTELVAQFDYAWIDDQVYREAGLYPQTHLRTLDAVHIAAALAFGADAMVTYDKRMADASLELGLPVVSPA